jgi:hypothetical protein
MRLDEILDAYRPTITAKLLINEGIDHPEDLIISNGSAGAERVVKELIGLQMDPSTISIKWDGFPAVVFGRDDKGRLVFMDKHMYDKVAKGKMDFMTIKDYDQGRGADRSDLWAKEERLRAALERVVPKVKDKFWMGDLMWSGKPDVKGSAYTFKPNTVEYQVPVDSALGQRISDSVGGIAVHTLIPGLGASDTPLRGLEGLSDDGPVVFLTGEIRDRKPKVSVDRKYLKAAQDAIKKHGDAADRFIQQLTEMKAKMVLTAMGPFITRMLEEGDIKTDIVPRFLEFLGSKLSEKAAAKLLGNAQDGWLYQADGGGPGLLAIWQLWAAVTDLKIHVKRQLDDQTRDGEIRAIINGADSHEGYVFGAGKDKLKIIDRLGFSAANFAKHKVSSDEIAKLEKMPVAAFCFGRMNPPTRGHEKLMDVTIAAGGANSFIFLSGSVNQEKDPLDPATKAAFISKIYPKFAKHIVREPVLNPIYAANYLYAKGFRHMVFVAGSDRLGKSAGSIEKILTGWNSGPVRSTDNQFGPGGRDFVLLKFVSSGERDPESTGVEGYSGSKARAAAEAGDERLFQQYTGVGSDIKVNGKTLYQAVRNGMGISDKTLPAKPAAKKPAPKKVAEATLTELARLNTERGIGWIDTRSGQVHYREAGTHEEHKDIAARIGIKMSGYTDYGPAYERGLVRFVTDGYPEYFEVSGNGTDLRKTFPMWWPLARKSGVTSVDSHGNPELSQSFEMMDQMERSKLMRAFGPTNEAEVWDKPSKKKTSKKLTASQKAAAKARAKRAGRAYPNLIDNMWASKR